MFGIIPLDISKHTLVLLHFSPPVILRILMIVIFIKVMRTLVLYKFILVMIIFMLEILVFIKI
jgi:hypothetical protein